MMNTNTNTNTDTNTDTIINYDNNIYYGSRNNDFKNLIHSLLKRGKLKTKYINILLNDKNMKQFGLAFTSSSADLINNYEVYEQMGDVSANKFIVWYMYKRFPQLKSTTGVKVVARLRINYGAKQSFSGIAENLGFWPFISSNNEDRMRRKKPLLEDVLEAFIGVTETILDDTFKIGVGYAIVNDILTNIFNDIDISLKYKDLYDSKTRLKELFDLYSDKLGVLDYQETKQDMLTISRVYRVIDGIGNNKKKGGQYILIGEGYGSLKSIAQQNAASQALIKLNKQGYIKDEPIEYNYFSNI